jgi:hypothetical protein
LCSSLIPIEPAPLEIPTRVTVSGGGALDDELDEAQAKAPADASRVTMRAIMELLLARPLTATGER